MNPNNEQLLDYLEDGLNLRVFLEKPPNDSQDLWINQNGWYRKQVSRNWDEVHVDFYKHICDIKKIKNPIKNKNDLLFDSPTLLYETKLGNKSFDFLILNSKPLSNQFDYVSEEFSILVSYLKSINKKVITTEKIKGTHCTRDYNFSIIDIARVSINSNIIIGVIAGPMHACFTKFNKTKKWYILSKIESDKKASSLNWWPDKITRYSSTKEVYDIQKKEFSSKIPIL